ncbi:MAG: hypothetical protein JWO96_680 [Candidatus Saccharibacteria bacterium]|nr:hypothetical protein [Candidatus Saccharibacteria bacterium]
MGERYIDVPEIPAGEKAVNQLFSAAHNLENYVNEKAFDLLDEEITQLIDSLNEKVGKVYAGRPVIINGLHRILETDPDDEETSKYRLREDVIAGIAFGFVIERVDCFGAEVLKDFEGDERQISERIMREQDPIGPYVVSHVVEVSGTRKFRHTNPAGGRTIEQFFAISPIRTSTLRSPNNWAKETEGINIGQLELELPHPDGI